MLKGNSKTFVQIIEGSNWGKSVDKGGNRLSGRFSPIFFDFWGRMNQSTTKLPCL